MKKPTVATLFAGCGGDSLGFTNGGFELVFANDNNPDACETMKKRFENSSGKKIVHKGNVEKVKILELQISLQVVFHAKDSALLDHEMLKIRGIGFIEN